MIPMAAVQASFETTDGLRVEIILKVTDEAVGAADAAVADLLGAIENYIAAQNHLAKRPVVFIHFDNISKSVN